MMDYQFEQLAKTSEMNGSGAPHIVGAAQIRAICLLHQQLAVMKDALICLNKELAGLDKTVTQLKLSIDKFNEDTSKLYSTLNRWTTVIAGAAIASAFASFVYASFYICQSLGHK